MVVSFAPRFAQRAISACVRSIQWRLACSYASSNSFCLFSCSMLLVLLLCVFRSAVLQRATQYYFTVATDTQSEFISRFDGNFLDYGLLTFSRYCVIANAMTINPRAAATDIEASVNQVIRHPSIQL